MKKISAAIFLYFITIASINAQQKVDLIISNAKIIDVFSGKISNEQWVVVDKGRILKVGQLKEMKAYKPQQTISAKGKFVMPALWDMHVHFGGGDSLIQENKDLLNLYTAMGITAVRDAAADITPSVLEWREAVNKGKILGPTIFTSGPKLEGYKSIWVGDIEVGTMEEVKKALDSLDKMKVDFVKITDNTIKPEIYLGSIQEARKRGYKTSAHIPPVFTIEQVSEAGLSSIEHITYLLRAGLKNQKELSEQVAQGTLTARDLSIKALNEFDEATAEKAFKILAKNNTAITPTLSISYATAFLDVNDHQNDEFLKYIGPGLRKTYDWRVQRAAKDSKEAIEIRHRTIEKAASLLPLLQRSGVKILAGTDAGYLNSFDYPGLGLHQELELMVKNGLTPLQALQASIINGPAFLGKSADYGSVSAGKKADILLLNENPLQNITSTQRIYGLVSHGTYLDSVKLKSLLVLK
ncbi:amidohydrolase [Emticicia oligotrophica DSM 17448]|uniref:Amidohydrolase n=1 Tax=Emticicia oligotrophica (strain DSM 17448 / CIP 109782 / MTCC 6937 / GPTSA100-15) TaxID=929562 RepID=A0ABN4AI46_EMTOG|nr:amidohydrolase family protein [Emticicia oligotrophica]AFK01542.1 amidohydrolase [Emticicia oligotrophica DSM 17448]